MENTNKQELRNMAAEAAAQAVAGDPERKRALDTALFRKLSSLGEIGAAKVLFCFVGVDPEPDTLPLIRALLHTGRRVAVPRCLEGGVMVAVEITSVEELHPGRYGIPEPPEGRPALAPYEIDAAIIPGVAFDAEGGRLGRGAGYYDRWLSAFDGFKCGICRDRVVAKTPLPMEEYDVRMDAVVTESRILYCGAAANQPGPKAIPVKPAAPSAPPRRPEPQERPAPQGEDVTQRITREELTAARSRPRTAEAIREREEEEIEPVPRKSKKRRRKVKRTGAGKGCLKAIIWFLLVIGISGALAGFGWLCADDLLSLTAEKQEVVLTVDETDDVAAVANKLRESGLIKYPWLFQLYGKFAKADQKIEPGTYTLDCVMDYRALVVAMRQRSGYQTTVDVTIPEGFTLQQVLERLVENGVGEYDTLQETCATHDFEYQFLEEVPFGEKNRLEGYLFPDTYTFYVGENPVSAVSKFLSNFSGKFTPAYRERAEELGYSMREILIIASLIEKEAADQSEMSTISSVIHNRLESNSFRRLQIDATIQYFLPERKARLSYEDLAIDNPYNTYLYEGLPPGPICNPGAAAIKAALYPKNTDYYFYALTEDGVHEFAKTAEEHQRIIDANPEVYGGR